MPYSRRVTSNGDYRVEANAQSRVVRKIDTTTPITAGIVLGHNAISINLTGQRIVDITIDPLTVEEALYPLSSSNGQDIRLEVLGPIRFFRQLITDVPLETIINVAGYEHTIIEIRPAIDTIVTFADDELSFAGDTDQIMIKTSETKVISPPRGSFSLQALDTGISGNVDINIMRRWNTLAITTVEE